MTSATPRRHAATAALVTALVVGCGPRAGKPLAPGPSALGSPDPSGAPAARPPGTAPGATEPGPGRDVSAAEVVQAALGVVSAARELQPMGPVQGVALSRAEMAARVRATLESDVPADVVTAQAEMLVAFGVAPPRFDYLGAIVSLMTSQLAGFYEPATRTMYLATDLGAAEREATLAHELVHALQDQHYDLASLIRYRPDASDAQSAAHALAEGDATSAMFDQMLAPRGMKATDLSEQLIGLQVRAAAAFSVTSPEVPSVLQRSLVAPYVDGIEFVHALRRRGGWAAVDGAWRAPPVSTEQLLHPEKFLAHEPPVPVSVPLAPDESWGAPMYTDVLGEQSVRLLLEEWAPRVTALDSASGWGGDRLGLWRHGAQVAMAWHLVADDVAAATRAESALLRGVHSQRDPGAKGPGAPCVDRAAVGPLLVRRRQRDVVVIAGPYERQGPSTRPLSSCAAARVWADRILASPRR